MSTEVADDLVDQCMSEDDMSEMNADSSVGKPGS